MERTVAIKKLAKLLGKSMGYRVDPTAPTADERAEAKEQLAALTESASKAEQVLNERRRILLNDPEYLRLKTAWVEARKKRADTAAKLHNFKFTAGQSDAIGGFGCFHVMGQGDSWEQVIEQVIKLKYKNR